MSQEPRVPPSPFEIGWQAMREGRTSDALHAFEQAYSLNPQDPRLHEALGELFVNLGNTRRARQYLQYAAHLDPSATGPRYQLALVSLHEGRWQDAQALLHGVLQLDPDHQLARQALEAEARRLAVARRLPFRQPARPFGPEVVLKPPKQVAPYGQSKPAPLRAPHHCVNCFYRPGHQTERLHAHKYHLWNLGLVGMLFGGWPVYLVWCLVARERRFTFQPLYCSVCSSNRRMLGVATVVLSALAGLFAFVAFIAVLIVGRSLGSTPWLTAFPGGTATLAVLAAAFAVWCQVGRRRQTGVRMRVVSEDEVGLSFAAAEYATAFRQLNGNFVVQRPGVEGDAEAESFVPEVTQAAAPDPAADSEPSADVAP